MKITWLGQTGLLFDNGKTKIMIDPYLSNSVEKVNPKNYRRVSVDERFFEVSPDIMIFTHDHLDHYDPETAPRFLNKNEKQITVLCPTSVWQKAREHGGGHNYVQFNCRTKWSEYGFRFTAVRAEHSDPFAIGVIVEDLSENKTYYITGDTLYNEEIFAYIPERIDVLFLPVNGVGNNMNMTDAKQFCERVSPKVTVPYHCGMFDSIDMNEFDYENKLIPKIYEEIELK